MREMVRVCAILVIAVPMFASSAQPSGMTTHKSFRTAYDASREITVTGNVHGILLHSKAPSGAHLLITTSQGLIDAHLGSFAFRGSQPLSLRPGAPVSVVGVLTWIDGSQILLARTVSTGTKTFVIRNERGALLFSSAGTTSQVRFKNVNRGGGQQ